MPTYEYTCTACRHDWEAFQSMKDKPLTKCPKCKARKAKRQVSLGSGFILKGGGWYSDLYSSQPNKAGSKRESSSSSSSSSPDSSSPDSSSMAKPANKTSSGDSASKTTSSKAPASTAA